MHSNTGRSASGGIGVEVGKAVGEGSAVGLAVRRGVADATGVGTGVVAAAWVGEAVAVISSVAVVAGDGVAVNGTGGSVGMLVTIGVAVAVFAGGTTMADAAIEADCGWTKRFPWSAANDGKTRANANNIAKTDIKISRFINARAAT